MEGVDSRSKLNVEGVVKKCVMDWGSGDEGFNWRYTLVLLIVTNMAVKMTAEMTAD